MIIKFILEKKKWLIIKLSMHLSRAYEDNFSLGLCTLTYRSITFFLRVSLDI